ncbi:MAG TPA: monofunctional biosynthetic peptidoglycan transglycosylase, partial [Bacillales bacterium]|nr:monofunctional biosynthetic peptidoglycan transglycosylase [Bacillales bacterium]
DKGKVLDSVTETHYSKKIWGHFMANALQGHPKKPFDPPKGVVGVWVDPDTGKLATNDCPNRRFAYYVKGTQPTEYCKKHLQDGEVPEPERPQTPNEEKPKKDDGGGWFDKFINLF